MLFIEKYFYSTNNIVLEILILEAVSDTIIYKRGKNRGADSPLHIICKCQMHVLSRAPFPISIEITSAAQYFISNHIIHVITSPNMGNSILLTLRRTISRLFNSTYPFSHLAGTRSTSVNGCLNRLGIIITKIKIYGYSQPV